jgi:hypothetical protein
MAVSNGSTKVDEEFAQLILSPRAYSEQTVLYESFRWLRANNPVARVEVDGYDPFWAVTKHKDILDISRRNDLFHSGDNGTVLRLGPRRTWSARCGTAAPTCSARWSTWTRPTI